MNRLRLLTVVVMILAVVTYRLNQDESLTVASGAGLVINPDWLRTLEQPLTPEADRRPPDQTFLTFPEWFLVHSPAEQAEDFNRRTASQFPYTDHVSQVWGSYAVINEQIKDHFPHNAEYHMMIKVIGVSSTVEYWLRQAYELVIGRITDTGKPVTAEDQFNQQYMQDYVHFIHESPWYLFDFTAQLGKLWSDTPWWGDHLFRKLERRYVLTSELMVKAAYGYLIGLGTRELYGVAAPTTAVVVTGLSLDQLSEFQVKASFSTDKHLVYLPRYRPFRQAAMSLAKQGGVFAEIAGNDSAILLSVLTDRGWQIQDPLVQRVFTQPIPADDQRQRVALVTPVPHLHQLLLALNEQDIVLEHVYDF